MRVGVDPPAEPPTQTVARPEKALWTLWGIERVSSDQHDHVEPRCCPLLGSQLPIGTTGCHGSLQRRWEVGVRQALATLIGGPLTEGAWERAKLSTCGGDLGIRVAQLGFAAQATWWVRLLTYTWRSCRTFVMMASLWAHDRAVANVIRPVPGQPAQRAAESTSRHGVCEALIEDLVCAEAVQAARLDHGCLLSNRPSCSVRADPGTGTMCTAMHKSPTGARSTAQWKGDYSTQDWLGS